MDAAERARSRHRANAGPRAWARLWALCWLVGASALHAASDADCELDSSKLAATCADLPLCAELDAELASSPVAVAVLTAQRDRACAAAAKCRAETAQLCTHAANCPNETRADLRAACRFGPRSSEWMHRQQLSCLATGTDQADYQQCTSGRSQPKPAVFTPTDPDVAEPSTHPLDLQLYSEINRAHCDSPSSCLNWWKRRNNHWQRSEELARQSVAAQRARTRADRINAANQALAISELTGATVMVAASSDQISERTAEVAAAIRKGGDQVSGALTTALTEQVGKPIKDGLDQVHDGLGEIKAALRELARPPVPEAATGSVAQQVDPEADFERIYPQAQAISYAVLLVPDPRVPRHRRAYDLAITATMRGMLEAGYVLDRYRVPWQAYLDDQRSATGDDQRERYVDDGRFGVLLFRHDGWRESPAGRSQIRALFVVAETGSFGVQRTAFARALARIVVKTTLDGSDTPRQMRLRALNAPESQRSNEHGAPGSESARRVTVVGPAFSGSLDSINQALQEIARLSADGAALPTELAKALSSHRLQIARWVEFASTRDLAKKQCTRDQLREIELLLKQTLDDAHSLSVRLVEDALSQLETVDLRACATAALPDLNTEIAQLRVRLQAAQPVDLALESASATAFQNVQLPNLQPRISYRSWALPDRLKLDALAAKLGLNDGKRVVFFTEASTFGVGLCGGDSKPLPKLCRGAREVHFPANIADIRFGARQQSIKREHAAREWIGLPDSESVLDLAAGAEDGSEFPESQRSPITAASAALELERAIQEAKSERPQLVVIAATDVRDRLFLFDRLRSEVPSALLVDMEADALLAHRSVIHATRGALVMGSAPLLLRSDEPSDTQAGKRTIETFATDDEALLFCLVASLDQTSVVDLCSQSDIAPQDWFVPDRALAEVSTTTHPTTPAAEPQAQPPWFFNPASNGRLHQSPESEFDPTSDTVLAVLFALAALLVAIVWLQPASVSGSPPPAGNLQWAIILPLFVSLAALAVVTADSNNTLLGGMSRLSAGAVLVASLGITARLLYAGHVYANDYAQLVGTLPTDAGTQAHTVQLLLRPLRLPQGAEGALALAMLLMLGFLLADSAARGVHFSLAGYGWECTLWFGQFLLCALAWAGLVQAAMWMQEIRRVVQRINAMVWRASGSRLSDWDELGQGIAQVQDLQANWKLRPTWIPPHFAATPFLSRVAVWSWPVAALFGFNPGVNPTQLSLHLAALKLGYQDTLSNRTLLAYVLAYLCERLRASLFASMAACMGVVALGYSWPVTARDAFLLLALGFLLLAATAFAYALVSLERSDAVSRLLSNTAGKTTISWSFVSAFVAPFVLVALAIVVLEVPGVMQWGGGLLKPLLGRLGVH